MDKVGRFEILREIGRGGMGVVYEAQDPVIRRKVAIKLIRVDGANTPRMLNERLLEEARAAGGLEHPGIVTIYDVGLHEGGVYIAMELVAGESLRGLLRRSGLPGREVIGQLLGPVAEALDYAHARGVIHRDIKPSNILIRENGTPCVVDFGMAVRPDEFGRSEAPAGGTAAYVAPEQVRGEATDGRADGFSLACVAYEALIGEPPFRPDRLSAGAAGLDAYTTLSERMGHACPALDGVFARALAAEPGSRYGSCSALIVSVLAACERDGVWGLAPGKGPDVPPPPRPAESASPFNVPGAWSGTAVPPPPAMPVGAGTAAAAAPAPKADATSPTWLPPTARPGLQGGEFTQAFQQLRAAPTGTATPSGAQGDFTQLLHGLRADGARTAFMDPAVFGTVLAAPKLRFEKIEETLRFYRDKLSRQYDRLERQAFVTYVLWIVCVALGFVVLIAALALLAVGKIPQGAATLAGNAVVYFIQRIFQQREDQYRKAADQKNEHLEYGNRWLLALQTIEAVEDPASRARCQARLAYELTRNLGGTETAAGKTARKKGR